MAYVEKIIGTKPVSRQTTADGLWFTSGVIGINVTNIKTLAEALDEADLLDLPSVKASAALGAAASATLAKYNLSAIKNSAEFGQAAWNKAYSFNYSGCTNSAKTGAEAWKRVKDVRIADISAAAAQGQSAWSCVSGVSFADMYTYAVNGQKAYTALNGLKTGIEYLTANYETIRDAAKYGAEASVASTAVPIWNALAAATDASASKWNGMYQLFQSDTISGFNKWQETYKTVNTNSAGWNKLTSAEKWQSFFETVSTHSGTCWESLASAISAFDKLTAASTSADKWSSAYSSVSAESGYWGALVGLSATSGKQWSNYGSIILASASNLNSAYSIVNKNYTNWNSTYDVNVTKWNTLTAAVDASAGKWNTCTASTNASAGKWNTYNTAVTNSAAKWNILKPSADKYMTMKTAVDASAGKWNALVDNSATTWDKMATAYDALKADLNNLLTQAALSSKLNACKTTVFNSASNWTFAYTQVAVRMGMWDSIPKYIANSAETVDSMRINVNNSSTYWNRLYTASTNDCWVRTGTNVTAVFFPTECTGNRHGTGKNTLLFCE